MSKNINPCLLLINDIHVSKNNIEDFRANWDEALSVCMKIGVTTIAVGGDLFMSRSSQNLDVLLAVNDALEKAAGCGIKIYLANGNHDKVDQEAMRGYCHVFDKHPNVTVIDDFLSICEQDWEFVLHLMAYFPEKGSFTRRLEEVTENALVVGLLNYLYVHQDIQGALANPTGNEVPSALFRSYDKVFVGHFHNRCTIPGTTIEYIGASRQFNFGEDDKKGYTVIFTDGSYEFHPNQVNVRYKVIDVPQKDVNSALDDRISEISSTGRYRIKVRIHGNGEGVDKSRLIGAGASKIEIVQPQTELLEAGSTALFDRYDTAKICDTYKEFCRLKQIEDNELGINYLLKIEESCGS